MKRKSKVTRCDSISYNSQGRNSQCHLDLAVYFRQEPHYSYFRSNLPFSSRHTRGFLHLGLFLRHQARTHRRTRWGISTMCRASFPSYPHSAREKLPVGRSWFLVRILAVLCPGATSTRSLIKSQPQKWSSQVQILTTFHFPILVYQICTYCFETRSGFLIFFDQPSLFLFLYSVPDFLIF